VTGEGGFQLLKIPEAICIILRYANGIRSIDLHHDDGKAASGNDMRGGCGHDHGYRSSRLSGVGGLAGGMRGRGGWCRRGGREAELFVRRKGTRLMIGDAVYRFVGANMWYAAIWGPMPLWRPRPAAA
jgi:hypothetical protein